ncbi:amidase [Mycena pura]|uniref:amidase n=1 Tax=Mycena pura TaxID=153505 RepID=A0AAD6UY28_9AGAR|nr:amidase [Mycena pura]
MWPFSSRFEVLVEAKRKQREADISAAPKFNISEHGVFLKATASEIVAHIERGEWTASQVVAAYISRAALAHEMTNCITEVLFSEAQKQAQELDAEFASTKQLRGPLHGVPLNVLVDIAGVDSSIGFSGLLQKPATTDADASAGAIPIAKSNVPQTMLTFECCNPVFGRTVNPYNGNFTSGGSSGGEAALLAMDGSALGVGSDIGGSLRYPAVFCGIYSFKPSPLRVSYIGTSSPVKGFDGIIGVAGPMGRSIDDLEMFCQLTLGVQARSFGLAPIPFREPNMPEKLRFGYYTDFYIKASPAVKRAVLETVAALRNQGHECIEIEIPTPMEAFDIFVALTSGDGYQSLLSGVGSDPLDSSLLAIANGPNYPRFVRKFVAWALGFFFKDTQLSNAVYGSGTKPVREFWEWTARRDKYNMQFYDEVWNKHRLDGIIAPVLALPQVPTGSFRTLFSLAASGTLYNVVNSPTGCVPVTRVDASKDKLTDEWTETSTCSLVQKALYQGRKPIYDPIAMQGMPVGIQVVGRKWEDEKVLAMMRVVDDALGKNRGFGPGSWDAQQSS